MTEAKKVPVGYRFSKTTKKRLAHICRTWDVNQTRALELMIRDNENKPRPRVGRAS